MKCRNCNRTVTRKSKFCPKCGSEIVHHSRSKQQPKRKLSTGYIVALVVLGTIVGYEISKLGSDNKQVSTFSGTNNIQLLVTEIAKEFNCVCGTCEHSLEICTCDHPKGSQEVKSFIVIQINQGHKKPHIVEMVETKYGGLKSKTIPPLKFDFPSN